MLFALGATAACPGPWKVAAVIDGDTVVVQMGKSREKVRLKGVDAPEVAHPEHGKPEGEPYGPESRECLRQVLGRGAVRMVYDTPSGRPERDQYGRLLAYLYVDSECINAIIIERGCARAMRKFDYSRKKEFLELEDRARKRRAGMWATPAGPP